MRAAGADAWYTPEADDILPEGTQCAKCGVSKFSREMDIIDVWFESGSSHDAVLGHEPGLPWPADLYLEGGDQFRGWFMSSLLCAMGTHGSPPYRMAASPGWTLDEQGRAMSKSRGNDVDPVDIANRLGGEIVRLWVASVDFREDVVGLRAVDAAHRGELPQTCAIRFRYILGNLYDFDPQADAVPFDQMKAIDQYVLRQTAAMAARWRAGTRNSRSTRFITGSIDFCTVELSRFYFDIAQRPAVHICPQVAGPTGGADRRSGESAKRWCVCWRRS